MFVAEVSSASLEYVRVPISAKTSGAAVNLTGDTVAMAFMPGRATPASGDWKTATWDTDTTTVPTTYRAQCLVGPAGTVTLVPGVYLVWVKITDSPEIVQRPCGPLKVT